MGKNDFAEIMEEMGLLPAPPATGPPAPPVNDCLDLSVQGGKFLGKRSPESRSDILPSEILRKDRQGNRTLISGQGKLLASEGMANVAWETKL